MDHNHRKITFNRGCVNLNELINFYLEKSDATGQPRWMQVERDRMIGIWKQAMENVKKCSKRDKIEESFTKLINTTA